MAVLTNAVTRLKCAFHGSRSSFWGIKTPTIRLITHPCLAAEREAGLIGAATRRVNAISCVLRIELFQQMALL
jgi:hypothetical protein